MLPTTGHFKNFNCPFYEICICERPYCHFKHSKKESVNDSNLISELVSKAVHKVLNSNLNVVTDVHEASNDSREEKNITYNPTPIAELNKLNKHHDSDNKGNEKKSRHIPIQYTPEQPRSSRSNNITSSYSHSLEYNVEDCANMTLSYSPTPNTYANVSYIPSSIKILNSSLDDNNRSDSNKISESSTQPYVPLNYLSDDPSKNIVQYSPTKNLSKTSLPDNEYVPKYTDDFIDEFINDPNIFESNEPIESEHKCSIQKKNGTHQNKSHEESKTISPINNKKKISSSKNSEKSNKHRSEKSRTSNSKHKAHSDKKYSHSKSKSKTHFHRKKQSTKDETKSKNNKDKYSNDDSKIQVNQNKVNMI